VLRTPVLCSVFETEMDIVGHKDESNQEFLPWITGPHRQLIITQVIRRELTHFWFMIRQEGVQ
jgi:hypothetical protein